VTPTLLVVSVIRWCLHIRAYLTRRARIGLTIRAPVDQT